MDEQNNKPEDQFTVFKNKEEFVAEVDDLIKEGTALTESLYQFGIRMAKDGMLVSGAADAYIGMKATVEILGMLKGDKFLKQIEEAIASGEIGKTNSTNGTDSTDFEVPKQFSKYFN